MCKPINLQETIAFHSFITISLATTGAIGATVAGVGIVATAGLFAAPAFAIGVLSAGVIALNPSEDITGIQLVAFALLSAAAIATGVALGIFSVGLIMTYALVATFLILLGQYRLPEHPALS